MELFLAKLIGLYFIIMGVLTLGRRKSMMPAVKEFADNAALRFVVGAFEIIAGLAILLNFNAVSLSAAGLIALVGYMLVIEGIVYLTLPVKSIHKMVRSFSQKSWYQSGGIIAILAGLYLAGVGFAIF